MANISQTEFLIAFLSKKVFYLNFTDIYNVNVQLTLNQHGTVMTLNKHQAIFWTNV